MARCCCGGVRVSSVARDPMRTAAALFFRCVAQRMLKLNSCKCLVLCIWSVLVCARRGELFLRDVELGEARAQTEFREQEAPPAVVAGAVLEVTGGGGGRGEFDWAG